MGEVNVSRFEFKLPDIGEGVMEGEIVKWLVQPGDAVNEDQPMVEVMTDKATVTITSPKQGKVLELGGGEGEVIAVHSTLVVLELSNGQAHGAEAASDKPAAAAGDKPEPAATAVGDIREELPGTGSLSGAQPRPSAAQAPSTGGFFNAKPLATPATRKLARDLGVDLRTVPGSGRGGRVMKQDVQRSVDEPAASGSAAAARAPSRVAPASGAQAELEVRRPLKGVRKRIFDSMGRSKHTAAHFTFVEECDVSRLIEVRGRLKAAAAEHGVRLTYLPFVIKAVVAALKKHPQLSIAYDEQTGEIVERNYFNIGIASATEAGLMVPVIKNADALNLLGVAREIERLGEATKSGRIAPDDLRGSVFTITSLGAQGGLFATPILNMPEVGILGVHRIKQKPVVRDGQIVVGDVMLLSLSFDHRLIDGHVGAAFAYEIIDYLENPERLMLDG
jgi:pyruvate dehydrogenase E2 component (dihydrolipoamide acetyltransferase)